MKRWHIIFILGQIFVVYVFMSDIGSEPTEESIWCQTYRPKLTFSECSAEFGY
jgi:hypothetical protein